MTNFLSHHGILGMKWGIRRYQNKDGTWTEAGKKRYGKQLQEASNKMLSTNRYRKAVKDLDKAYKEVKEYYNLPEKERDKYYELAARNAQKKYGDPNDEEDFKRFFYGYKYDDLDVGYDASFSFYLKDKGIDPKVWSKKEYEAYKKFNNEMKDCIDKALKEIGPEDYSSIKADAKNYERIVDNIIWDIKSNESGSIGYWFNPMEL